MGAGAGSGARAACRDGGEAMIITLRGYSDDLVCVGPQGAPHSDEVGAYGDDATFIELSTGQVFSVVYSREGIWRIAQVAGSVEGADVVPCPSTEEEIDDGSDDYSDVATIACPEGTTWCSWSSWPPKRRDVEEFLRDNADEYFEQKLSDEEIFAARRRFQR